MRITTVTSVSGAILLGSVAIEELSDSFVILGLSIEGATIHGQRELLGSSWTPGLGDGVTFFEKGLNVRIVVFHISNIL